MPSHTVCRMLAFALGADTNPGMDWYLPGIDCAHDFPKEFELTPLPQSISN